MPPAQRISATVHLSVQRGMTELSSALGSAAHQHLSSSTSFTIFLYSIFHQKYYHVLTTCCRPTDTSGTKMTDLQLKHEATGCIYQTHVRQRLQCCCCDSPAALLLSSVVQVEEVCDRSRVVPQILHCKLRRMERLQYWQLPSLERTNNAQLQWCYTATNRVHCAP